MNLPTVRELERMCRTEELEERLRQLESTITRTIDQFEQLDFYDMHLKRAAQRVQARQSRGRRTTGLLSNMDDFESLMTVPNEYYSFGMTYSLCSFPG